MNEEDVVIKQQDEVRVFLNKSGGISIAQNDDVIAFHPEHAEFMCLAIENCRLDLLSGDAEE